MTRPRAARRFPGAALAMGLVLIGAALVLVPLLPTRLQSSTPPE